MKKKLTLILSALLIMCVGFSLFSCGGGGDSVSVSYELSGGMLQRAMIAAAIISRPKLLLADEPTTALDVTIQAEILELLKRLNKEYNMAILLISHNLHVVRKLCKRVAVMQRGKLIEDRPVEDIFNDPRHEYTQKLIAAIPTRDKKLY